MNQVIPDIESMLKKTETLTIGAFWLVVITREVWSICHFEQKLFGNENICLGKLIIKNDMFIVVVAVVVVVLLNCYVTR